MLRHMFYRTEWSGTKDIMYIGVYYKIIWNSKKDGTILSDEELKNYVSLKEYPLHKRFIFLM